MTNDDEQRTLSVVVPVYYNEESLGPLFDQLKKFETFLAERNLVLELIFVDDGSGDESFRELRKIRQERPGTKIIKLTRNFGALAASKTGLRYVSGDCFTILAADLQDPIEKVQEMVDRWLAGRKFVICARAEREDPPVNRFFAAVYYAVVRLLVVENYPRGGFDMMLLDRELLPHMITSGKNTHPHVFAFWLGFEPDILTYARPKRAYGRSRWSFAKRVVLFLDTITGFSVFPLRLASGFGVIIAGLSFAYGMFMFVSAAFGDIDVRGFPTIVVLITFFSGLILMMLGLIGEYLWRIFDVTQRRPESVIEETLL